MLMQVLMMSEPQSLQMLEVGSSRYGGELSLLFRKDQFSLKIVQPSGPPAMKIFTLGYLSNPVVRKYLLLD